MSHQHNAYDVVIVGSGTCGATLAKSLSQDGRKVLVLEQGGGEPLRESFGALASMAREVAVGGGMKAARAVTVGGSTAMYFAVANRPPLDYFSKLGIDLSADADSVWDELPIDRLPDPLMSPQSTLLAQSAAEKGLEMNRNYMIVDQKLCGDGYRYEAKWKARSWIDQAQTQGCELISGATVTEVLVENNRAVGVKYRVKKGLFGSEQHEVRAKVCVLAGGSLSSPQMLRKAGLDDVGAEGFYCDPGYPIFGLVPQLEGRPGFVGSMQCSIDEGIEFGDANMTPLLHRMLMLMNFKWRHMFAFERTVGVGVKVVDGLGGSMSAEGKLNKTLTAEEIKKLEKGRNMAIDVLKQAGAKHIFCAGLTSAGHVGGMIKIGRHVDDKLQTSIENLYVCDGSLLDENIRVTPTVTLICLARHLSRHLAQVV